MPTAAAVAPAIPGAFEGLWALLAALGGALAGAVGGAILPVVLVGVAVVGTTVLGLETYKHLTAEKGAVTPTIAEKILEAAREKEEEPIKVSPDDSDLYDGDGNLKQEGGGRGGKNNGDNGEEKPAPVEPRPESGGSSSENVPEVYESSGGLEKEGLGKISGKKFNVTREGIDNIRNYLVEQDFINDYENLEMLKRLEAALKNGEMITGADASYYLHELKEAELVSSGIDQVLAHKMALQFYGVSPYSVYHPAVIMMKPEWWNGAWFEFWGIGR